MRIDIKGSVFAITTAPMDHTRRRLSFALTRSSDRIERMAVRVGDSNGVRGGENKFCRIQIHLKRAPQVLIEDSGAEVYAAIDRAAERAGRNVAKRVDRQKEIVREAKRQSVRSPPGDVSDVSND
jgi:putative sigma-54 modulation protein